ncbi:hypothetical protein DR864_12275 [Runella rosea]|uniref:Uncharacterized protein n=1 Tax=Runella rosea TaxID=2259595 RepID=A0A344TIK4_9BACT|nr:hypothetical protein [Runella rosea]AXE18475.1 hypothetical protein DR864_12275 [Runella rosea]
MNYYQDSNIEKQESRTANSRFAKAGVSYFYDSEVLNSSFVHLMKFSAKNPRHIAKHQTINSHYIMHSAQKSCFYELKC